MSYVIFNIVIYFILSLFYVQCQPVCVRSTLKLCSFRDVGQTAVDGHVRKRVKLSRQLLYCQGVWYLSYATSLINNDGSSLKKVCMGLKRWDNALSPLLPRFPKLFKLIVLELELKQGVYLHFKVHHYHTYIKMLH